MSRTLTALIAALTLLFAAVMVASADDVDVRARSIAKRLQCPICESVSVADSPAELAVQMRGVIRVKVEAGETDDQIIQYFVGRYGEGILLEPPRHGFSALVWAGPVVALIFGGIALTLILQRRRRPSTTQSGPPEEQPWMTDAAERELRQLGGR